MATAFRPVKRGAGRPGIEPEDYSAASRNLRALKTPNPPYAPRPLCDGEDPGIITEPGAGVATGPFWVTPHWQHVCLYAASGVVVIEYDEGDVLETEDTGFTPPPMGGITVPGGTVERFLISQGEAVDEFDYKEIASLGILSVVGPWVKDERDAITPGVYAFGTTAADYDHSDNQTYLDILDAHGITP